MKVISWVVKLIWLSESSNVGMSGHHNQARIKERIMYIMLNEVLGYPFYPRSSVFLCSLPDVITIVINLIASTDSDAHHYHTVLINHSD